MFIMPTIRRSEIIIRKILDNDKSIGKIIKYTLCPIQRHYNSSQNDSGSYGKDIVKTYASKTLQNKNDSQINYSISDALIDTISIQTDDIKHIKLELIALNVKIKKIIDALNYNSNEIEIIKSHAKCTQKEVVNILNKNKNNN
jgi:hypothetical protein